MIAVNIKTGSKRNITDKIENKNKIKKNSTTVVKIIIDRGAAV